LFETARAAHALLLALACSACTPDAALEGDGPVNMGRSLLTASERRVRAGQIRDAAFASGMTQGYLLAGIADAETSMSHCWSELTWACQGPPSADCGGGPVVAGAGDGPCADLQGGLGMFQFDAGTHAQTLQREGDRILSIAGNTQAAVDFVVSMLIRSVYVDGIDDAAQAIAWSNGVRPGNERWDPWIRTVTHYYNGCTPSASCWNQRYAHYRDNTSAVYDEMGAAFWEVERDWAAEYVAQSFPLAAQPFELAPEQEVAGYLELRNAGTQAWTPGATFLGTTEPRDGASPLAAGDWHAPHRAATVERAIAPGETGRFAFTVRAPREPGDYPQFFNLVQENVAWFGDRGGPPDDQLQVRVTVVPGQEPDPADAGPMTAPERDAGGGAERDSGSSDSDPEPDPSASDAGGAASRDAAGGDADGGDAAASDVGWNAADGGCSATQRSRSATAVAIWLILPALALLRRRRRRAR
jgi:uncharacterized protein (TIGR03382 family)